MKEVAYCFSESKSELMRVSDMNRVHLENAFVKYCPHKITTMSEPEFLVEIKFTTTDDNEAELREKFLVLAKSANIPSIGEKILYNLTVTEIDKDV